MTGGGCANCSAVGDGATRTLVVEHERTLEVPLCERCYDAFVADVRVETGR